MLPFISGILYRMQEPCDCHESVKQALEHLHRAYPDAPLLALGQTVFWDEPTKVVLLPALQSISPQRHFVFAAHDTDYFGKLPSDAPRDKVRNVNGFALLPHNDGATRGLWSAAGELSQLFGSETVPTRNRYIAAGVPFEKIARFYPGERESLVERMTEAWGWRGMVRLQDDSITVSDLPLADALPALIALLEWGTRNSIECLVEPQRREQAEKQANMLLDTVRAEAKANPEQSLADLYEKLYQPILAWLTGGAQDSLQFSRTSQLLRFDMQTAMLPRFSLLDAFLKPETRALCEEAYNQTVRGSEVYTLERFGEGALPFDLVIPGMGRGTLLITDRYFTVQTPNPIVLRLQEPIRGAAELARFVEQQFGDQCALVGKAITLISMLATEFIFVMNERGSSYLNRTKQLHAELAKAGIEWPLHPLLRLRQATWDTVGADCIWLKLPEHLAESFGQTEICSPSFAGRWRAVVQDQTELMQTLKRMTRLRDLICELELRVGGSWVLLRQEYDRLQSELQGMQAQTERARNETRTIYQSIKLLKAERAQTERDKGAHFRATLLPLREKEWELIAQGKSEVEAREALVAERAQFLPEREAFDQRLNEIKARIEQGWRQVRELNQQRMALERDPTTQQMRQRIRQIDREAELARMRLVRHAILATEGLALTQARPAWWWFMLLSPDRRWFLENARHTEAYLEPLDSVNESTHSPGSSAG